MSATLTVGPNSDYVSLPHRRGQAERLGSLVFCASVGRCTFKFAILQLRALYFALADSRLCLLQNGASFRG